MGIFDAAAGVANQLIAGQQNRNAEQREYQWQMQTLDEGPSHYLQGMEKAGLNPLLMAGGTPGQALQSNVRTAKSDPAQSMMAGIALAKSMSEIKLNQAKSNNLNKDTEATDQQIRFRDAMNPLQLEYQAAVNRGKDYLNQQLQVEAQKATSFGYKTAQLEFLRNELSYTIAKRTGIEMAEAQLLSVSIANLMAEHNYNFFHEFGIPDHGLSWVANGALLAGSIFEKLINPDNLPKAGQAQAYQVMEEALKNAAEAIKKGGESGINTAKDFIDKGTEWFNSEERFWNKNRTSETTRTPGRGR